MAERDTIMLHACFQVLTDSVDEDGVDLVVEYNKYHKVFVDEVRFLYAWWKKRKEFEGEMVEDNEMLLRLMTIREQLWI